MTAFTSTSGRRSSTRHPNTSFCVSKSDRVNNQLPEFNQLRMRTDEHVYIHTSFDLSSLPYIERLYIGTGSSKREAYADMISTSGANAATNVDCNYNAYTDTWIAIGYRRTADASSAIRDLFLYIGDDPSDSSGTPTPMRTNV